MFLRQKWQTFQLLSNGIERIAHPYSVHFWLKKNHNLIFWQREWHSKQAEKLKNPEINSWLEDGGKDNGESVGEGDGDDVGEVTGKVSVMIDFRLCVGFWWQTNEWMTFVIVE